MTLSAPLDIGFASFRPSPRPEHYSYCYDTGAERILQNLIAGRCKVIDEETNNVDVGKQTPVRILIPHGYLVRTAPLAMRNQEAPSPGQHLKHRNHFARQTIGMWSQEGRNMQDVVRYGEGEFLSLRVGAEKLRHNSSPSTTTYHNVSGQENAIFSFFASRLKSLSSCTVRG